MACLCRISQFRRKPSSKHKWNGILISSSLSKLIRHYINEIHVMLCTYINLIVFGVFSPTQNFSLNTMTLPLPVIDLMVIEQWGFLSVPHLLWHGAWIYNSHLRGPVILTPATERLAVELLLPVFRFRFVTAGIRTPDLPHAWRTL